MHVRARVLTGISMAAILAACLTSTAHADGATDAAEAARQAAYKASLAARQATPVKPADVAKYAEAARFRAVAANKGMPTAEIDSLLNSGAGSAIPSKPLWSRPGRTPTPRRRPRSPRLRPSAMRPSWGR